MTNRSTVNEIGTSMATSDELTEAQLDAVNGGFLHWLFPAAAVDATFGDAMRKLSDAMGGTSQVVASPNGEGDYKVGPTGPRFEL